jgi:outer membrane protein insertion porin family
MNKIYTLLFFLLLTQVSFGQDGNKIIDYNEPKMYEIGQITVTGNEYTDENAVIGITGLRVGSKVRIPGEDISKAVQAMWRLRLFKDVSIVVEKIIGDVIFLKINLTETPRVYRYSYQGVKKSIHETLNEMVSTYVIKGASVKESNKVSASNAIKRFYIEKGFLDVKIDVEESVDTTRINATKLDFIIDKGEKVKIENIYFVGNTAIKAKKLRGKLAGTKKKGRFLGKSKYVKKDYDEDKTSLITYYNTIGYRDAYIISDSIWRNPEGELAIQINIAEGQRYYFRNIIWKGNSIYDADRLNAHLRIEKGDVYNEEELTQRLNFSQDGTDVSTLYQDKGYLFFRVDPIETAIDGDSIDLEMRIFEGPQATIDKVEILGNDRTHEHVIRRELDTQPGKKFSRSDIIRSQRKIIALGYFDPEKLNIANPINQQRGTVDLIYTVEERPSDQLELSAGWGGFSGIIGTLGVTFNNFSIRNIFNGKAWRPLPQGDGQKLSIRAQTNGQFLQSYNFSFTEPWLGGNKPNSFSLGGFYTKYDQRFFGRGVLAIARGFIGLGSQLKWPDNSFISNTTLNIENINLDNYSFGGFFFNNQAVTRGSYNNFSIKQVFARSTIYEPIFPTSGSKFSLTLQFTPPYSLFGAKKNYDDLSVQDRFKWLEYHKWRFDAEWYTSLAGKLVLKTAAKIGLLSYYNSEIGLSPFERFELGGDGLSNQTTGITGKDILALRGYEVEDLDANQQGAASVFNKFTVELRYPISSNPNSSIFLLTFLEGGNSWIGTRNWNPFDLKRSAGMGLRVFLPMFGLLGFDYGFGFDKPSLIRNNSKWTEFGKFSIILGFEPD